MPDEHNTIAVSSLNRCSGCDGSGWVERVDNVGYDGHVTMVPCSDPDGVHLERKTQKLSTISGLSPQEMLTSFEMIRRNGTGTAKMLELAEDYVQNPKGFFTVWGGYGNGKTLILQATVNEFRNRYGIIGTYVRLYDLLEFIREGYKKDAKEDARARYQRLKVIPVLAIDECDGARMNDYAEEFRRAFFDDRYRLGIERVACTVMAMNVNPAHLPGDIYDRIRDRRFILHHNDDRSMRPIIK